MRRETKWTLVFVVLCALVYGYTVYLGILYVPGASTLRRLIETLMAMGRD